MQDRVVVFKAWTKIKFNLKNNRSTISYGVLEVPDVPVPTPITSLCMCQ